MTKRAAYTTVVCALLIFIGEETACENLLFAQSDSTAKAHIAISTKKKKRKKKRTSKKTIPAASRNNKSLQTPVNDSLKRSVISTKRHLSKKAPKKSLSVIPPLKFNPTTTGAPGTVKSYFFPDKLGATWKLRTVQLVLDDSSKILRADTVYSESRVTDTARFSLQRLPLMVTTDSSYRVGRNGVKAESIYYVDDSVAMTVFNNSISHGENHIFLVAPLKLRNAWHVKLDDTTITMIAGFGDSIMTPLGKLHHVMVTLSQQDYSDMRTYYVPGYGIVKTVYRSLGPSGKGLVIMTTEMIEFKLPEEEKKK